MASTEALKEQMRGQEGKTVQKVDPNTVPVKTLLSALSCRSRMRYSAREVNMR